ncbi:GAF domain-containing protein [Phormidium tenue FACHB-886]|nr:GAF domain-containing protein [Phormidium tenue FACHB-886]
MEVSVQGQPSQLSQDSHLTQTALLQRITNRIRQSLDLQNILSATVAEVRSFLGTDRVKIYQFQPDASGVVIAEAIFEKRLPSLLGLHFPADDIPLYARELFVRARQRSIVDLSTQEIGISRLDCPDTDTTLNEIDIRYRAVDPCHVEYLTAMGVQSSVVVPIVLENQEAGQPRLPSLRQSSQLWGLLVSHHSERRSVSEVELQFIQAVVDQVSIAIAQSGLLDQVRRQAQQEANINRVTALLYATPTVQLQAALEETVNALQGIGGRLYLTAGANESTQLYTCGEQPQLLDQGQGRPVEENLLWQKYLYAGTNSGSAEENSNPWSVEWMRAVYALTPPPNQQTSLNRWAIGDLYREPLFRSLAPSFQLTQIRGLLILPLRQAQQVVGCLTIFRKAIDTEVMWAGCCDTDSRQLMPRQSFEAWQEQRIGHANWTEADMKLAQALGERFSMAVKQYRLYQQVQTLNQNLEQQVRDRTADLQISNAELQRSTVDLQTLVEQQQILARIVAKIRQSLELDDIFEAAVAEVRQLLNADRAVVYRCYPNPEDGGQVIAEDVLPGIPAIVHFQVADRCISSRHVEKYRNGQVHAIDDLSTAELHECYAKMLETIQIKSVLAIPLVTEAEELWGFLCIHQCSAPRQWLASEIEFAGQITTQLNVAIQHSLLLRQLRQQADQLTSALDNLKQTQTHLIQSEKMSSLGQLVAGVAHEINNPVSFIYGNLDPIRTYTQTLLDLLQLYRQEYPHTSPELQHKLNQADLEFIIGDLPKLVSSLHLGANRIREIVLSLRNFSRLDQTGIKTANLHEGIDHSLLILQHRLKASQHEIKVVCNYGDLPLVECFPGQLNQVFMNLLVNAIDALQDFEPDTEENSADRVLTVTTQCLNLDRVQVSIKDNGNGIPSDVRERLFDPFFTTKPTGKGIGLGLSISYQIVEKHQGKLYCISEPDEGAEFVVELPVQQLPIKSPFAFETMIG